MISVGRDVAVGVIVAVNVAAGKGVCVNVTGGDVALEVATGITILVSEIAIGVVLSDELHDVNANTPRRTTLSHFIAISLNTLGSVMSTHFLVVIKRLYN